MNINEYQLYEEVKAHTSIDFPYNTYICSIPLNFKQVPLHWHSEIEIIVIKKGCGIVTVDLKKQKVTIGDIIFIRSGQLHSIEQDGSNYMEYENILFKKELLISGEYDLCAKNFIIPLIEGNIPSATFFTSVLHYYNDVANCINEIDILCSEQPEGYQLLLKSILFRLIYIIISHKETIEITSNIQTKSLEKLKYILKYVEEHYSEHITIEEMAKLTFYSKSHFMKFFKSHIGTGFIDYLNNYRLMMSEQMLKTSDLSVIEIAQLNGFDNISYFNRIFKKKYNLSPSKLRKNAKKQV